MDIKIHDLTFEPFITEKEIQARVAALGGQLKEKFGDQEPIFIGMLSGAFVFMADIIRAFDGDCEVSFVKYFSYEGTESTGILNEVIGVGDEVKDRTVILIEDIVDSGHTLHRFLPKVFEKNPAHVEIVSLLVKPDALKYDVPVHHIGFEIEDKFVVGYGLDYNGLGRNLGSIYKLKK